MAIDWIIAGLVCFWDSRRARRRNRALDAIEREMGRIERKRPGGLFGMSAEEKERRLRELDRARQRLLSLL